jgi:hypothetical protein
MPRLELEFLTSSECWAWTRSGWPFPCSRATRRAADRRAARSGAPGVPAERISTCPQEQLVGSRRHDRPCGRTPRCSSSRTRPLRPGLLPPCDCAGTWRSGTTVHAVQQAGGRHVHPAGAEERDTGMGLERTISVLTARRACTRRTCSPASAKIAELSARSTRGRGDPPAPCHHRRPRATATFIIGEDEG